MCDNLLCDVFNNKINLDTLLTWLSHRNANDCKHLEKFGCSQNNFVSYFLNYIFEVLEVDKNGELLQKRTKKLETANISKNENVQVDDNDTDDILAKLSIIDTPKRKNDLNHSYVSPLSPLYNKQNYFTPKNNNRSTPRTTPCLGDFLITSSSKKKPKRGSSENVKSDEKNKTRIRRINPTNLVAKRFSQDENSFTFKHDDVVSNSNEQHDLSLAEELPKLLTRRCSNDHSFLTETSPCSIRNEILPDFQKVTFKHNLDISVSIYIHLLNNNFVLNLASEIYFLISVLLEKKYSTQNDNESNFQENVQLSNFILFKTIHNRVYFAANVLQRQIQIFKFLDRFTLNLFIENSRVKQFLSDDFITDLAQVRDEKSEKCFSLYSNSLPTNVCFNLDTDNRDNFPTAVSFQAFCKQRDMFCEILRIWEKNHLDIRWDFAIGLGGKIKSLLNVHADPANLVHLARLFKAKLMVNLNTTQQENSLLFSNVKSETMSQLNNRIAPKQSGCGINSVPSFVGYEEFYWEFLVLASNQTFNKHVSDAFASEIADLTNSKFISVDLDSIESFTNVALKQSYMVCIKSTSVLAKFLGFLESLPYKCDSAQMSQNVIACQVRIRSQFHPSINLNEILSNCTKNYCLLLAIPWMVNYIAMLDYITVRLPYFKQVFYNLFEVYYNFSNGQMDETAFLIKLSLGWLFDLPHFPKEMYYQWLSQKLDNENHLNRDLKLQLSEELLKIVHLDNSKIIDQIALYSCCPYLNDIKTILVNNSSKVINQSTVKYATLLPASKSSLDITNKRLQTQLEEAFFNGQPASIRKTVEFVSERIASTCVKEIFNEIVPSYKKIALKQLKDVLRSFTISGLTDEEYLSEVAIINERSKKCTVSSLQQLQNKINYETNSIIELCIGPVIDFLLIKELSQVKDVCVKISKRMCRERIQQWRDSNITTNIFMKDFDAEVKQFISSNRVNRHPAEKAVFVLPTFGTDLPHNPKTLSGFNIVDLIRNFSLDVVKKSDVVTPEELEKLLDSVDRSIKERCDLNECILLSINTLLLDLLVLLIAHLPDLVDFDILNRVSTIWKEYNFKSKNIFTSVISTRNLMFFNKSTNLSWKLFEDFIVMLLNENFLTFKIFEEQAVKVYKSFKCDATRKSFLNCSVSIVNNFKDAYDFTNILSVLSN